jgi:hypothetical protein
VAGLLSALLFSSGRRPTGPWRRRVVSWFGEAALFVYDFDLLIDYLAGKPIDRNVQPVCEQGIAADLGRYLCSVSRDPTSITKEMISLLPSTNSQLSTIRLLVHDLDQLVEHPAGEAIDRNACHAVALAKAGAPVMLLSFANEIVLEALCLGS